MIELEQRIRRYVEAVADPAAMGPDPAEDGGAQTPVRSGRLVLVACLVALVAVVGGVLAVSGRHEEPASTADQSVTSTKDGQQVTVALTVESSEVAFGDTITAHAVLTNTSPEPITVLTPPGFVLSINWGPTSPTGATARPGTLDRVAALYSSTPFQPAAGAADVLSKPLDPRARATLAPGESVTIDAVHVVGDDTKTGSVEVTMVPSTITVIDGKEAVSPLDDMSITVPITVGPSPAGTITLPDAIATALADPEVVRWAAAIDTNGGVAGAAASTIERTADGWRLLYGATDGNASGDLGAELRQFGGPGLIVRVDADRHVTVEWIAGR